MWRTLINFGNRLNAMKSFAFVCFLISIFLISSCEESETIPEINRGSVTDSDGNVYSTVKIGGQWWMTSNLRVTTFRNGESIPQLVDSIEWLSGGPGFSIHPDATTEMGLLYNWKAVSDSRGIAPEGWHVATDEDWQRLEKQMGMETSAAEKFGWRGSGEGDALKATGTNNWVRFDPVWATNAAGFNALAGSCRIEDGRYGSPGTQYTGFWWTRTLSSTDPDKAFFRYLDYKRSQVFRQVESRGFGFSVRCVKDQ